MGDLKIIATPNPAAETGGFGARIENGALAVPASLAASLLKLGVGTAAELLSYATAFPSSLARSLQWSEERVQAEAAALADRIRSHAGEEMRTRPQRKVRFGAIRPPRARRADG